jgi:hypothetical protein
MIDSTVGPTLRSKKPHFSWIWGVFLQPRATINQISAQVNGVWLLPLVVLSLTALAAVGSSGWLKQIAAQSGEVQLPPDFQYYTPEQQEKFMQAIAATSGPAFVYALPGLARLITIFFIWLLVGNLLHLVLTMFGGRSTTATTLNLVAWSGLPFALRDLVRTAAALITHQYIQAPGLSGFAPLGAGKFSVYLFHLFGKVDIYLILNIFLLVMGARTIGGLSKQKAWAGVLIITLAVVGIQALVGYALAQFGTIQVIRPFLF